jgi:hypothetical protein
MRTLPLFLLSVCLLSAAVFAQNPTVVTQTVQATDVPRAIPDVGHITSTVTFPVSGTIVSMELFFQFIHQCERDLIMDLIAPDGHDVQVMNRGLMRCSGVLQTFTVSVRRWRLLLRSIHTLDAARAHTSARRRGLANEPHLQKARRNAPFPIQTHAVSETHFSRKTRDLAT